ncbi:MAG: hypothetical protein V4642_13790 [Bacteroidota bacterium]
MKKLQLVFLLLVSVLLLDSCATKLPIPINGKTALYRYRTAEAALSTDVNVTSQSGNPVISIAESIGSGIAGWKVAEKLQNAVNEDTLASVVSEGLESTSQMYCSVKFVESLDDNPDLIFETEVLEYSLMSNEAGAGLMVRARTRLIERSTSRELWDSEESRFISFSETGYSFSPIGSTVSSLLNLQELLAMPDEKLADLMYTAAFHAGEYFGEELREANTQE